MNLLESGKYLYRRKVIKITRSMSLFFSPREPPIQSQSPRIDTKVPAVLRKQPIRIDCFSGKSIDLDAIIQDGLPGGSDIGTVVACHGSPGSHEDFKYILPHLYKYGIRFIGINFPGHGITSHNEQLSYSNEERIEFVQKSISSLNISKDIVFMGHSRGSENVLKMAAINVDRSIGLILINPMGVKIHRGIRPTWLISFAVWLWESLPKLRFLTRHLFYTIYRILHIKVRNGDEAAICLKTMASVDLGSQVKYIETLNDSEIKILVAYSTLDRFIEVPVSQHFVSLFRNMKHLVCPSTEEESPVLEDIKKRFLDGEQCFAVCFENAGHFLQKYRAKFIADCIYSMMIAKNRGAKQKS